VRFINYPSTEGPTSVALGDLNGDGLIDIALAGGLAADGPVSVMFGSGGGAFASPSSLAASGRNVVIADFDRDGKLDMAFIGSGMLSVLIGRGDGTFAPVASYAAGSAPGAMAVGDVNGDRYPDIAVASESSAANGKLTVLLNAGNGTFGAPRSNTVGSIPTGVAIGDLNGDGFADIVVVCEAPETSQADEPNVLVNKGDGTFLAAVRYPMPSPFTSTNKAVAIGDVNHDGSPDIVTAEGVLLNKGHGTFMRNAAPYLCNAPIALADLDGDGTLDIASGWGDVILNTDSGTFAIAAYPLWGGFPSYSLLGVNAAGVAIGDLNRDGRPDIVLATDGGVSVRVNQGPGAFLAPAKYEGAGLPTIGDLNGDGKLDMVASDPAGGVDVFINKGAGILSNPIIYDADTSLAGAASAIGDFNGDNVPDLAVALPSNGGVRILLNEGAGTFAPGVGYPAGSGATTKLVALDLDGDGRLDLVLSTTHDAYATLLFNRGNGVFSAGTTFDTGLIDADVAVEDLNGDGSSDLAVVDAHDVRVFFNNGDGTFPPAVSIAEGHTRGVVGVGDVNGDGFVDLAVASLVERGLSVFLNDGKGHFAPKGTSDSDPGAWSIALADLNGDGRSDIVTSNATGFSTFVNNGDGTFAAAATYPVPYPVNPAVTSVVIADLNGDGRPEVILGDVSSAQDDFYSYGPFVFLNTH